MKNKNLKYQIGIFFLVMVAVSPLLTGLVPFLAISKTSKIALSGFLLAGAPEIFLVLAGIFAGKELIIKVKNKIKGFFSKEK